MKQKTAQIDKGKIVRQTSHLTRPPRLEGKVKNAMMNPVRKSKKPNWRKDLKK